MRIFSKGFSLNKEEREQKCIKMNGSICIDSSICTGIFIIAAKEKTGGVKPPPVVRSCSISYIVLNALTSLSVTPPFPSLATTFQ